MAALTTQQKYDAVCLAIDSYNSGAAPYSFNLGDLSVTYRSNQMDELIKLRSVFAHDLTARNVRKRTQPDFSG